MKPEDLAKSLANQLRAQGVEGLPKEWVKKRARKVVELTLQESAEPDASAVGVAVTAGSPAAIEELAALRQTAEQCQRCRLCETRNKVVFGTGETVRPLIAFIGEGPGAEEDRTGEPFVGRAGQLLTGAITKGMGLRREDVYICNVVKCRPPENRAPLPDEVQACTPYLYRQLELIQPQVIITLGQPAQLATSGVEMGITKLRGQWQSWRGFKLMPTFHPAYILRNPPAKRFFWEDLQSVMAELGLPLPKSPEESA